MRLRSILACLALTACTSQEPKSAAADTNSPADIGAADTTSKDTTPSADTTADALPQDTVATDTAPYVAVVAQPVGPGGTYAERCQKISAALCAHLQNCCTTAAPGCIEDTAEECMDPGKFAGLATAAAAGNLVLDPKLTEECDAAVAAVGSTCSKTAAMMALIPCLFAWTDPAGLGQPCQDGKGEVCAGGKGRCAGVDMPTCVTATAIGAACPKSPGECVWGAFCGWPAQNEICVAADSFCGTFGDVEVPCSLGKECVGGACVVDMGVATGGACAKDADCRGDNDCLAGKCVAKLCKNLPGD